MEFSRTPSSSPGEGGAWLLVSGKGLRANQNAHTTHRQRPKPAAPLCGVCLEFESACFCFCFCFFGPSFVFGFRKCAVAKSAGWLLGVALAAAQGNLGAGTAGEVQAVRDLRSVIVSLGPFFIKLGQALSIRPDILSPQAMVELQQLCDKVRQPN